MCPFILLTFFLSCLLLMAEIAAALITLTFNISAAGIQLHEGKSINLSFRLKSNDSKELPGQYRFLADRPDVAQIVDNFQDFQIKPEQILTSPDQKFIFDGIVKVQGNFLGYSRIQLLRKNNGTNLFEQISKDLSLNEHYQLLISVIRDKDILSKVFIYSVAIVVSISYINMGCALDMDAVFQVLRRPIAPAIGIFSQYVCMPLIAFALASFFLDETYLKLGIFIFGCSPGGGASNMWTVLVKGNLNLSIAMTFLSTLLSIGFMPIWLYTLGRTIFEGTTTSPPFRNIFTTLASMVIFLGIGLLIKRFFPRIANIARRILAPFSGMMIIFIIVFGTYSNFYMFRVMNFKMIFAAAINVWCGMFLGFTLAYLFRKPMSDMLTIAIETGVQNTGVSIVVLGLSLKQPDADLASAVPVAASLMTPIPLTIAWLIVRLNEKFFHCQKDCPEVCFGKIIGNDSNLPYQTNQYNKSKLDSIDPNNSCSATQSISSDSEFSNSKSNLRF
ncbi:RNA-binding protein [Sarcoptes scabiei]|nr:RNA-binding protein [Sarcoptes scabiei]